MRWLRFFLTFLVTIALIGVLSFPLGSNRFAIGDLLDPYHGFWQNARQTAAVRSDSLAIPGLLQSVEIRTDSRGIPHIFAQNEQDLFRAQGFVEARDRLWQMEFQIHAAAGRLAEFLGPGPDSLLIEHDRTKRRKGLPFGAERALEQIQADQQTFSALEAYSAGVNAFITSLKPGELPLEYKLLNYLPEKWTPYKSCLLLKYMSEDLAGRSDDIAHTHALRLWGKPTVDALYPAYTKDESPIIPPYWRWSRRKSTPGPAVPTDYHPDSLLLEGLTPAGPDVIKGSNNWAVAGSKSETGYPLLANDPHLGLNLPSIWYELQLSAPTLNAYGVGFPGVPGIVLGFNDSIAWGSTNSGMDVLDYYTVTYRDDKQEAYRHDGQWLAARTRIEEIKIKDQPSYFDTVRYTHMGPVMYDQHFGDHPVPLAIRWMAHEPSNEFRTFLGFNRADNYAEFQEALSTYVCPAQNFIFASAQGDIALWQQGKFVNKWDGQGRFVMDGSRREHMWNEFIPQDQIPHIENPPEGLISSANQRVTSAYYPYYYNGHFDNFRGRRIHELLQSKPKLNVADMQAFQLDTYSKMAEDILPLLLTELDSSSLDAQELKSRTALQNWDLHYGRDQIGATLFDTWFKTLYRQIWQDDLAPYDVPLDAPKRKTTIQLLLDSVQSRYYGAPGDTSNILRTTLINQSFQRAVADLNNTYGAMENWQWRQQKTTSILHLTRSLAPFSRLNIPTDGGPDILNATTSRSGPSWRMVVSLGPDLKAYGVYPGGQSGNLGDASFDAFIDSWAAGEYFELLFLKNARDTRATELPRQVLSGK